MFVCMLIPPPLMYSVCLLLLVVICAPWRQWRGLSRTGKLKTPTCRICLYSTSIFVTRGTFVWRVLCKLFREWKLPGRHFSLWVIDVIANNGDTQLNRSAGLGNVFRHKTAIQYLKQVPGSPSKLVSKVVWETQSCMVHCLALKKTNVCRNPCVWMWKRWKQYKTWLPKQALKWIKPHLKLMKSRKNGLGQ